MRCLPDIYSVACIYTYIWSIQECIGRYNPQHCFMMMLFHDDVVEDDNKITHILEVLRRAENAHLWIYINIRVWKGLQYEYQWIHIHTYICISSYFRKTPYDDETLNTCVSWQSGRVNLQLKDWGCVTSATISYTTGADQFIKRLELWVHYNRIPKYFTVFYFSVGEI